MRAFKSLRLFATGLLAAVSLAFPVAPSFATVLTVTASNVVWQSGPVDKDCIAGEAFASGALVYLSASGTWLKAQGDGTAIEAGSLGIGIALATADVAGARVSVARPEAVVSLGTGTAGTVYIVGDTAGGIYPAADAGTTDKVTVVAVGIGSNKLKLGYIYDAGSVVP